LKLRPRSVLLITLRFDPDTPDSAFPPDAEAEEDAPTPAGTLVKLVFFPLIPVLLPLLVPPTSDDGAAKLRARPEDGFLNTDDALSAAVALEVARADVANDPIDVDASRRLSTGSAGAAVCDEPFGFNP